MAVESLLVSLISEKKVDRCSIRWETSFVSVIWSFSQFVLKGGWDVSRSFSWKNQSELRGEPTRNHHQQRGTTTINMWLLLSLIFVPVKYLTNELH